MVHNDGCAPWQRRIDGSLPQSQKSEKKVIILNISAKKPQTPMNKVILAWNPAARLFFAPQVTGSPLRGDEAPIRERLSPSQ
jgi:hypothetical protein